VTAGTDYTARIWNTQTGEQLFTLKHEGAIVLDALFDPTGTFVATSCEDRVVRLWDVDTGKVIFAWPMPGGTNYLDFSPAGDKLAAAGADSRVYIWDVETGQEYRVLQHPTITEAEAFFRVVFNPDGTRIAAAGSTNIGVIWDVETGDVAATLRGHQQQIFDITYSPSGDMLATASAGTLTGKLENGIRFLQPLGGDRTARLWNAQTGEQLFVLPSDNLDVWSVAFSPDGKQVASGGSDDMVRIWDTRTGELVAMLPDYVGTDFLLDNWQFNPGSGANIISDEPIDWVLDVNYSPSGDRLLAASASAGVKIYLVDIDKLLEMANSQITRELTCEERQRFLYEDRTCESGEELGDIAPTQPAP